MRKWQRSNLIIGESVKIPPSLFIEPCKATANLIRVEYAGETDRGILLDFFFKPAINTNNPEGFHYKRFIDWTAIYCGLVKLYKIDGEMIRAKKKK